MPRRSLAALSVAAGLLLVGCHPPGWGQGDDDGAPDAGAAIDAARGDGGAPDAAAPDAVAVTCDGAFRLDGYGGAATVWLSGDFVGWAGNPTDGAVELTLGGDGAWTVTRTFDAGSYVYKFIVDGTTWIVDPGNPVTADDGLGGFNSVYVCE
ncbi:MAG: hypothetical protein H6708_22850 [Kofleriaceae bacterium]|nr:hypothetical protein [Kofleriaceae bacterium]